MGWGAVAGAALSIGSSLLGSKKEEGGYSSAEQSFAALEPIAEGITNELKVEADRVRETLGATGLEVRRDLEAFGERLYGETEETRGLQSDVTSRLTSLLSGDIETSPAFEFMRDEALQASERAFQARGQNVSGNVLRGLSDVASGQAGKEFYNQLQALTGLLGTTGSITQNASAQLASTKTSALNMYSSLISQGENLGAQLFQSGQLNKGSMLTSAMTGQAQAQVGAAQASAQGIASAGEAIGKAAPDIIAGVSDIFKKGG